MTKPRFDLAEQVRVLGADSLLPPEMTEEKTHAPLPYDWVASATAAYGNMFHAYLTDANGRKIAAIWGKEGEKEKTANLLMTAANCHADLLKALAEIMTWYDAPGGTLQDLIGKADDNIAMFDRARAAIAKAEGRT